MTDTKTTSSELRRARQLYRLCCGIEYALATCGYRATVRDAIKAAGMSRRTFYAEFESLHDAYKRMQFAMGRATERNHARMAHVTDHKEGWHKAYVHACGSFPSADTMLAAMAYDVRIDASRLLHLEVPLDMQSYIVTQFGQRPLPKEGPFDDQILLWARDMDLEGLSKNEAAQ